MSRLRVLGIAAVAAFVLLASSASLAIDYAWWSEMGQTEAWNAVVAYTYIPRIAFAVVAYMLFRAAFALGRKRARATAEVIDLDAGTGSVAASAGLLLWVPAIAASLILVRPWTIVQFFGSDGSAQDAWRDPMFGHPLSFYLFDVPFYSLIVSALTALVVLSTLIYFLSSIPLGQRTLKLEFSTPLRWMAALGLAFFAARLYLGRYDYLTSEHGFLTGADYVDETIRLPLQWFAIFAAAAAAVLLAAGRYFLAVPLPLLAMALKAAVPGIVSLAYVKPNELSLEKPYIERHIAATLSAFGMDKKAREIPFAAKAGGKIDFAKNRELIENVRLWDWQAFRDTVSQVQPLRPYTYKDIDVDRYKIDGVTRQVMVAPRELDIEQLGEARRQWINPNFVYTHGYGLVMAEANKINSDGLPLLYVQDAPPSIKTPSLQLKRPEIYFGEIAHEPVFVNTAQQEFDYPSGSDNVHTHYQGKAGIPISGLYMRLMAALHYGDRNILLTSLLTGDSKMLIHRNVDDRLETLAGFVDWDRDPYLVVTDEGRMVWIVDGYMTSDAHPYSHYVAEGRFRSVNYIRNSVKATVDAYDGETKIYVFDPTDPVIGSYRKLFPQLLRPASEMPAGIRAHLRYGEKLFRMQAQIYRTYHMRDAEAFYNKADLWDPARYVGKQGAGAQLLDPAFVMAALPGEKSAEFLLVMPFSPRGKDNLIGYMAARNDGDRLGEIVFLQMPKQEVLLGPMQLEARIDQDQTISKDLTLWNQQGSQVLRGQTLIVPVDNSLLYVKPLYLQASNARMPQLKKVVVAAGNRIVYEDTYERAIAALSGGESASAPQERIEATAKPAAEGDRTQAILERLSRLRRELDALETEIRKK